MKLNTVLMRGVNDDEAAPLVRFALAHGYQLRFIEQMPLDPQHAWDRADDDHRGGDPGRAAAAVHADARDPVDAARPPPRPGWSATANREPAGSASSPR